MATFGNGSDGDVVISSNTTLTAAKQYNNLTVNSGITLNTAGYLVQVANTLLTVSGTSFITDSSTGGTGGNPGSGGARKTNEGDGNNGSPGSPGTGNGGDGGAGGGSGAGQSHSTTVAYGGAGGIGGAGGKGGGNVQIEARTIINNGVIHANGFVGNNGSPGEQGDYQVFIDEYSQDADIAGGSGGGGDGGDGGDGGTVNITYEVLINNGTISAEGGVGGQPGDYTSGVNCDYTHPGSDEFDGGLSGNGTAVGSGGHGEEGAGASGIGQIGAVGETGALGTITLTSVGNSLFGAAVF